jgi:hypothetical protein
MGNVHVLSINFLFGHVTCRFISTNTLSVVINFNHGCCPLSCVLKESIGELLAFKYQNTVHPLTKLNATVTSWLLAGTA